MFTPCGLVKVSMKEIGVRLYVLRNLRSSFLNTNMHLSDLKNISGISIQYPLFARTTRQVNAGVCMEHIAGTFRIPAIILPQRQRES